MDTDLYTSPISDEKRLERILNKVSVGIIFFLCLYNKNLSISSFWFNFSRSNNYFKTLVSFSEK